MINNDAIVLLSGLLLLSVTLGIRTKNKKTHRAHEETSSVTPPRANIDGYCGERPKETHGFVFQQTMIRVKDAKLSLDFYSRVLGMRLIRSFDFPEAKFSLFFLGYINERDMPQDDKARKIWLFQQPATLELTYNYGTELQADFKYNNGNVEPNRGYGHIGIDVPDVASVSCLAIIQI